MELTPTEVTHLHHCADLAETALADGDQPFGSIVVDSSGRVLVEDRNRISGGDRTRHPEFEIARWAAATLTPAQRSQCTVYTSGEHCPMCSAAHAWVGLGPITYAASSAQLTAWLDEWGLDRPPVASRPINEIAPHIRVRGPAAELHDRVRDLHRRYYEG